MPSKWKPALRRIRRPQSEDRCREIARILHQARIDRGITLQAVADALGRSRQQIDQWETGTSLLTVPVLIEWALALGYSLVLQPRETLASDSADPESAPDARLVNAFRSADQRTREAIAMLLGIDRPPSPPIDIPPARRGRPRGVSSPPAATMRMSAEQLLQLRAARVPFTGNKLLVALKLVDARITQLAGSTSLGYGRVGALVRGKTKMIPLTYAQELASSFGCEATDLFPSPTVLLGLEQ